jgi:hypothetical protein
MSGLVAAVGVTADFVSQVSDPTASAPAGLMAKTDVVLGLIKWASLIGVLGLLLASGMVVLAGDRGYGGGMSPELKSSMIKAVVALVIVGSAAQIVNFVS